MRLLVVVGALALSACSLTPVLDKPAAPVPAAYPGQSADEAGMNGADLGWRSMFGEPRLQRLMALALDHNRDLKLAALNVEAVRAQYGIQRAARMPAVDASAGATRQRAAASEAAAATTQTQYSVGLASTAFEIDLFGRVAALSDAALARWLASEQGRRAAQITLVGEVADAYFAERLAQEQLQLSKRTLADWRQSLDLARRWQAARQSSGLDVAQAEGQVATAEVDLQARERALAQAGHALRLLVGTDLPADAPDALPLQDQPVLTQLPAGLPSDLLTRRPDIRQAEQALVAANADIGAARAALFPLLSLTASAGYASPALGRLFDGPQRMWSFAPQLSVPLFDGGRLRAELRLAELRKSSAVVDYERAIQVAFREVADGLAGRETFARQLEAQASVVASAERRAALSGLRYRAGTEGRLELLDAQRQLYAARQAELDLRRSALANAVALYKALGGGMRDDDAPR
ncbi:efflux transporter outer membrane subunit [Aquincola tertiaricarbonis]|uniref:Efflux transporter outer membrane subunit n=1 Tax=Aquincola tertiaricarbonis TaxID=391953 RepID=A0ABY4S6C2_AQUTE|nr:efflux transporter outer membrane subunit [Aquincola tertiaricarbonis]URI08548.1 efflux transporter outer membrane subunit [Aquincola tertiaricarbonis]